MNSESTISARFKTFLLFAVAWAFVCGVILLQFWPIHPQGKYQWALFVVLGPPAYVLLESLVEQLLSKRRGYSSGSELGYGGEPQGFSLKRVLAGVSVVIVVVIVFMGASWVVSK